MKHFRAPFVAVAAAALALVAAACSGDPALTGEAVIESELADQIGLGELTAECEEPENREVGTEFACSATTEDGQRIEIVSQFDAEDEIFVFPTNVLPGEDVPIVRARVAELLGPEVGAVIDPDDIDCGGPNTVVLDGSGSFECVITQVSTGDRYPLTITLTEFVRGEGFQRLDAQIGDALVE